MSEIQTNKTKLLVDLSVDEVCNKLFFLKPDIIEFWMNNEDFKNEYRRRISEGAQDGFYLFYVSAEETFYTMRHKECADEGFRPNPDFATANQYINKMRHCVERGFGDSKLDQRFEIISDRIAAPAESLRYWSMVPEFVDSMNNLISSGQYIGNTEVYDVMKRVYNEKTKSKLNRIADGLGSQMPKSNARDFQFSFGKAKDAIRALEKRLKIPTDQRVSSTNTDESYNIPTEGPDQVSDRVSDSE